MKPQSTVCFGLFAENMPQMKPQSTVCFGLFAKYMPQMKPQSTICFGLFATNMELSRADPIRADLSRAEYIYKLPINRLSGRVCYIQGP